MRHYSLLFAVTCLLVSLSSCQKNDYSSYPPTWKGFQITNNGQEVSPRTGIFAGDKITVTALQDQKGQLINATTYNWSVTAPVLTDDGETYKDSVFFSKSIHTNYDGYENGSLDPSIEFTIPSNALGRATVKFSATYAFSGNGIQVSDGGNYENSGSVSGYINSGSSAQYGKANGSVSFTINARNER